MRKSLYRGGDTIIHTDGRIALLVRRNEPYLQWRVQFDTGKLTWWWESDFTLLERI